jgi:hypothetical protein
MHLRGGQSAEFLRTGHPANPTRRILPAETLFEFLGRAIEHNQSRLVFFHQLDRHIAPLVVFGRGFGNDHRIVRGRRGGDGGEKTCDCESIHARDPSTSATSAKRMFRGEGRHSFNCTRALERMANKGIKQTRGRNLITRKRGLKNAQPTESAGWCHG